jgi:RNA polymerase sigma-70 factor (ECF subfamily)
MTNQPMANERFRHEGTVTARFLETPHDESFSELFHTFQPQLVSFFRARGCHLDLAEDLSQEVMFTVYCKAEQLRDRTLFRAWLFKVARNALCRHYGKKTREVDTVNLEEVHEAVSIHKPGTPAFEFYHWMGFLDSQEREVMALRFVEEWEYHEIAAAQASPIGTVQWRVFNAKKKLAPYLRTLQTSNVQAA